jgi:hypothetical protein
MKAVNPRRRSRLRVLAAALVAASQFAVSAFAPMADSGAGNSAPSHVEAFGVSLHFAHNPDDCAACLAQSIIGITSHGSATLVAQDAATSEFDAAAPAAATRIAWSPGAPRAPPAPLRARLSS